MIEYRKSVTVHGREIGLSTGVLAQLAGGSVLVQSGETAVLVTATMASKPREGIDFFPLLVDYEERLYAAGRIPGSFVRREGRPPEKAILAARLIDRPLRPLFPKGFINDVQIVATVLALDMNVPPDILAILGASTATMLAGIPFDGPVAATRVGLMGDDFIINPTYKEIEEGELDLVVAGTKNGIMMVEAGANCLPEEDIIDAIDYGYEAVQAMLTAQEEFIRDLKIEPMAFVAPANDPVLVSFVEEKASEAVAEVLRSFELSKDERDAKLDAIEAELGTTFAGLGEEDPLREKAAANASKLPALFKSTTKKLMRKQILVEGKRVDGRSLDEVRPISSAVRVIPRVHGCGLFTRGTTQVLSVVTLGTASDAQELDDLHPDDSKRYMHHYNFPGFSVGEVKPLRGVGRREVGHGALAERAIVPILPEHEQFPYVIRVVSEVLSSNGSTSMGSVCASTLALMDAGVPIREPVSGVAMGLIKEGDEVRILTDIQGIEDFLGDMDFKVAGTRDGITALQMDIKIQGITLQILEAAIQQSKAGRLHILEKMLIAIDKPRVELSPYAPRLLTLKIPVDMIGLVIGPGGKTIKRIVEETGAKVDIEDDGTVVVSSIDGAKALAAKQIIEGMTRTVEVDKVYLGTVTRIIPNLGAFVEVMPGKEGLVHISQLAEHRVRKVEDELNVGDEVVVKVKEIDQKGRINLTRRGIHPSEVEEARGQ
ncbi:polyribonucleotide nucleotidyltransferase [Gloeobacter violaceus]|uniref:Polyribonucleotide nucleotidyltransferase n=1 Tax=Gloeobacter violaceus (strain ATCC 29082 / PCC 7421) TaxID=251221 RepID=PNP_GLOVI|nr:polyribonucleotide nucleotidyltransferase [Gloeobacter violaceus]Q7NGM0.1 RecName: Full=Polyribonucleotide nucleotidyltransferase; AltName: Full=Polynucleotide phosphorylase; Short=PNPase [Gloeobacter violaceus PCC 7421]BAC91090.1 polyribonucleotide nucleotidyltransferase [Gloeobacter violaceus PCC 7421]